ncbi:GFA family protein, partial [Pseudoalteromonas sp. Isolate6]|uniref:GFA family protein n=1 Tax=Pseudoalteromonas sp. Isolate6 TaxID=2908527 RepID=UPI001EFEAD42
EFTRMSSKVIMYLGSCLCGEVKYKLLSEPKKASHCHCNMCQKQHGAAFATYASLPKSDVVYLSGSSSLTEYNSSANIKRKFCKVCRSSIEWGGSENYPDWVSVAIATLDTPYKPKKVIDIRTETKVCWLNHS